MYIIDDFTPRRKWANSTGCPGWIRTISKGIKNPYAAITSPDNTRVILVIISIPVGGRNPEFRISSFKANSTIAKQTGARRPGYGKWRSDLISHFSGSYKTTVTRDA